jgi:signal transduction histidine kinase
MSKSPRFLNHPVTFILILIATFVIWPIGLMEPITIDPLNFAVVHLCVDLSALILQVMSGVMAFVGLRRAPRSVLPFAVPFAFISIATMLHIFGYPGMPTSNLVGSTNNAVMYWQVGQMVLVAALAQVVWPRLRRWQLGTLAAVAGAVVVVLDITGQLPPLFYVHGSMTLLKKAIGVSSGLCLAYFALRLEAMVLPDAEPYESYLVFWPLLQAMGHLSFALCRHPGDLINLVGHFQTLLAACYLFSLSHYLCLKEPWQKLHTELAWHDHLERLVDDLGGGILMIDHGGRVLFRNHEAELLVGLANELPSEWQDVIMSEVERVRAGLETPAQVLTAAGLDGARFSVRVRQLGRDEFAVLIVDMAAFEEVQRREALRRSRVPVAQMAAATAHELKNLLTPVRGFVELIAARAAQRQDEKEKSWTTIILQELARMDTLTRDFMGIMNPGNLKYEQLDVEKLWAELAASYKDALERNRVSLNASAESSLPFVFADFRSLRVVFSNLIQNAIEAMPRGGSLELRAAQDREHNALVLSVSDTGEGIPAEVINKIFDPFFTTKPTGTGLGMAVVEHLVTLHGGHVVIDSAPGKGTRIEVRLPVLPVLGYQTA